MTPDLKGLDNTIDPSRRGLVVTAGAITLLTAAQPILAQGFSWAERLAEDHAALAESIPAEFWRELQNEKLIDPAAPLPIKDPP